MKSLIVYVLLSCSVWGLASTQLCRDGFEVTSPGFSNSMWNDVSCDFDKGFRCARKEILLLVVGSIEIHLVQGSCDNESECNQPCGNFVSQVLTPELSSILQSFEVRYCDSVCCNSDNCNNKTIDFIRECEMLIPDPSTLPCITTSGECACNVEEITALRKEIRRLKRLSIPEPGWFTPLNGYQYQLTETRQNWWMSRRICRSAGGDLATKGMRNFTMRSIIARTISNGFAWIGLNDIEMEGRFVWLDGVASTPSNTHWKKNEPSRFGSIEDCAEIFRKTYRTNDRRCTDKRYGLCEKML